jgi:hypothetical protein
MTGVLLGFNLTGDAARHGLLGFAIARQKEGETEPRWLEGALWFKGVARPAAYKAAGALIPSNVAPIQKFRWSDYSVYPGTRYAYTVHPVYGTPTDPDVGDGPTVVVETLSADRGEHRVRFNRAVASSQAFTRRFGKLVELERKNARAERRPAELPPQALEWLGRGVPEALTAFLARAADDTWAVDVAIYQYELPLIVAAVNAAARRGVKVRVVYHAKKGDAQTVKNERSLGELDEACKVGRLTSAICHHKFIVLSKLGDDGRRRPQAVLTGSTNFTQNGCYFQANVVHQVENPATAATFLALFDVLFARKNPTATSKFITTSNPMAAPQPLFVGFSPRAGRGDLAAFAAAIRGATRDVLFCTAFDLYEGVTDALLGAPRDPILRLGVQDKASKMTGVHRDRTAQFTAAASLPEGIEGFLKERRALGQTGNILLHAKVIVVDFTTDRPTVISGSHNYSMNASRANDENYLMVHGDTAVADAYGVEVMRVYDHYRFRYTQAHGKNAAVGLERDWRKWTAGYYPEGGVDTLASRDRKYFSGSE